MIDTARELELIEEPFTVHLAQGLLTRDQVDELYAGAPMQKAEQIARTDPDYEKQYRMNLLYLVRDGKPTEETRTLSPAWTTLVKDLLSDEFTEWLEAGTDLDLRDLHLDVGIYTHVDGDFISVHKDKPNKAITAIVYLNNDWPQENGGAYEVRACSDPAEEPVRRIYPRGGQFLAFPPTDTSFHSVSKVHTGDTVTRLTVQLEYWFEDQEARCAR
jgi:SM-20-related protein